MKKILVCFVMFISSMLFYNSYDSYNLMNYARILNLDNYLSDDIQDINLEFLNKEKKKEILKDIVDISVSYRIQFMLHDLPKIDDGTRVYRNYIYTHSNDWIYEKIQMKSGKEIDFTDINEDGYLSSCTDDSMAQGTYTSYDNSYFARETEVIQLTGIHGIENINNDQPYLKIDSKENSELIRNYLEQNYRNDVIVELRESHGGTEKDILTVYKSDEILLIAGCGFIIAFLILVCIITKEKKEIMIRRMNGQNAIQISMKLYLKSLWFSYIVFVFTFIILWLIFVGQYHDYYHELFFDIEMYCLGGIGVIIILFILASLYIQKTTSILEIKNAQSAKKMLYINSIIKIGMSIILTTPFISNFSEFIPSIQKYKYIVDNEEELNNYYGISDIGPVSEEGKKELMQFPYCSMEEYNITNTSYFTQGMDSSIVEDYVMNTPFVVANEAFLKDYVFYDENNHKVNLNKLQNKTLIIPTIWKNKELKPENKYVSNYQINVKSTGTINSLSLSETFTQLKEPVILFVNEYDAYNTGHQSFYLPKTQFKNREYYEKEILKYTDYVLLNNHMRDVSYQKGKTETQSIQFFTKIALYATLYSLFVIQFMILYIQEYRKELSIKYLLGQSKWNRYADVLVMNLCICFMIILIGNLMQINAFITAVQFAGLIIIFDSLLITIFIRRFEKKSIVLSLKGEY